MSKPHTPPDALSPSLARLLAEDPETWTLRRLWGRMPLALKQEAVRTVLDDDSEETAGLRASLLSALARAGGYRRRTLEKLDPARAAGLAGRIPRRSLPAEHGLFSHFLTHSRQEMLARYLDVLGVPHENGRINQDYDKEAEPDQVARAARTIREEFPADDVAVYLVALSLVNPNVGAGLPTWLQEDFLRGLHGEQRPVPEPEGPEHEAETEEPELIQEARREDPDEEATAGSPFTALDRTLIRAVVDSSQEVRGALDSVALEDLVDEVVELNSDRHSSYFHRGFLDAMTDRRRFDDLPAENPSRRAWYASGWISGMVRRDRHEAVVQVHDDGVGMDELRALPEAADLALPFVFDALCRAGRPSEAVASLPTSLLLRRPVHIGRLLEEGTRLLRSDQAESARPLFDRLGEAVRELEAQGEPTTEPFFLEIRRRRAHCYRQLGEGERARALLERLLTEDPDPGVRAMVLADLGLLDAGYRSLADMRLWRTESEASDIRDALERGEARFKASVELPSRRRSHGAWPLGVLAMARQDWEGARGFLSTALSGFLESPERYGQRRLIPRVHVAAGIAEAMATDYARLPRAAELLLAGVEDGARIPGPLMAPVLAALEIHEEDLASRVLSAVLAADGPGALDLLLDSEAAWRTPAVALALLERAGMGETKRADRARDLRNALPILLSPTVLSRGEPEGAEGTPSALEAARSALDQLEGLALEGVEVDAYLELVSDPERLDPAWGPEEAAWSRITVLEATDRRQDAVGVIRSRLERVLARQGPIAESEAEGLLAHARSYGLGDDWTGDLEQRFAAWQAEFGSDEEEVLPEAAHPQQQMRVLIVGGDERQNELEARVQRTLDEDSAPIRVKHLPTGWSGNWSGTLDEALREAERHQAVVLLRFMRTEFGRSLRAGLGDRPWVSCPGVGTAQVTRMVRKAAAWSAKAASAKRKGDEGD